MIDYHKTAAILFPTMTQDAPAVPPVEATTTTETAATHTTTDQSTPTAPHPDAWSALTLPEDAVLEASAIERTTAFAKAAGLSPEVAQKALEHANREVAAYQEKQTAEWHTLTRETWVHDVKADPEIGGEKFTGAVTDAKRFLEKFGDEEVRQFLDDTGFGNHKFVIRLFSRAEKGLTNHRRLTGRSGGGVTPKTTAQVLFPSMPNP
jgi:hypothetical protein